MLLIWFSAFSLWLLPDATLFHYCHAAFLISPCWCRWYYALRHFRCWFSPCFAMPFSFSSCWYFATPCFRLLLLLHAGDTSTPHGYAYAEPYFSRCHGAIIIISIMLFADMMLRWRIWRAIIYIIFADDAFFRHYYAIMLLPCCTVYAAFAMLSLLIIDACSAVAGYYCDAAATLFRFFATLIFAMLLPCCYIC